MQSMNIAVNDQGVGGHFRLGIVGTGLIAAGSHLPAALGSPGVLVTLLVDQVAGARTEVGAGVRVQSENLPQHHRGAG